MVLIEGNIKTDAHTDNTYTTQSYTDTNTPHSRREGGRERGREKGERKVVRRRRITL